MRVRGMSWSILALASTSCWVDHCEVFPEHCVGLDTSTDEADASSGESGSSSGESGSSSDESSTSESSSGTTCGDGVVDPGEECDDQNDSNADGCLGDCEFARSCKHILDAFPTSNSGVYEIDPDAGNPVPQQVQCDMDTDGGGWTLVASSKDATPNDAAGGYYAELATINPTTNHVSVWNGMRPRIPDRSDIRFTCLTDPAGSIFAVDLSFYDIGWYREITTGTDAESCFSEADGLGEDPPPARRNNVDGSSLPAGDPWASGYLEGEDICDDVNDFTVDFDDRGKDGNQADGTDWGEDDGALKCGSSGLATGAWHIWVREI